MRASSQWSYLEMLRIFGFAHDKDKTPGQGDLAWFCVACPQPGFNLPENWHEQKDQSASLFIFQSCNLIQLCLGGGLDVN